MSRTWVFGIQIDDCGEGNFISLLRAGDACCSLPSEIYNKISTALAKAVEEVVSVPGRKAEDVNKTLGLAVRGLLSKEDCETLEAIAEAVSEKAEDARRWESSALNEGDYASADYCSWEAGKYADEASFLSALAIYGAPTD